MALSQLRWSASLKFTGSRAVDPRHWIVPSWLAFSEQVAADQHHYRWIWVPEGTHKLWRKPSQAGR